MVNLLSLLLKVGASATHRPLDQHNRRGLASRLHRAASIALSELVIPEGLEGADLAIAIAKQTHECLEQVGKDLRDYNLVNAAQVKSITDQLSAATDDRADIRKVNQQNFNKMSKAIGTVNKSVSVVDTRLKSVELCLPKLTTDATNGALLAAKVATVNKDIRKFLLWFGGVITVAMCGAVAAGVVHIDQTTNAKTSTHYTTQQAAADRAEQDKINAELIQLIKAKP